MSVGQSGYDHQLKIDTTTRTLNLIRDDRGAALYKVIEEVPKYDAQIKIGMSDWSGGHGQLILKDPTVYYDGQSIDTTLNGKIILGPEIQATVEDDDTAIDSAPVCSCWFSAISKLMMATAKKVYWWNGTKWAAKKDFSAIGDVVDMVEYNGYLFVALGTGAPYYYSSDGANFTACTLTDHHATKFFVSPNAAGTANVLWKALTPNQIASNASGINGGAEWSSPAYIGDTSNNITNIFIINDRLLIGRTDNLYHYDADGGVHPLMDNLKHNRSTTNFQYFTDWQTSAYFSLTTGLGEISAYNAFSPVGPLSNIDDINKTGVCVGLTSDKDFIYVAMNEGTTTTIYKGREVRRNGVLRWEWCPFVYLGTNSCTHIRVVQHSSTDRRLWFGYGTAFNYVILSDNPLADSNYKFTSSGWIRFSYYYGNNPLNDKLFQTIVTETKGCGTNIKVTPKYRKDTDTSMTSLTGDITTNGVVHTNLTSAIDCKRVQFELDLATNDSSKTPEVTWFEARGTEKPTTVRIHECVYSIGDTPSRRVETVREFLRNGRLSNSLIRFADLRYGQYTSGTAGTDFVWVVMLPGSPQEVEITHEKGRQPELGMKCQFMEIPLATATISGDAATLPTGVANCMVYYNGTTWTTITPSGVMGLLSGNAGDDFSMNNHRITGLATPVNDSDAATKKWVADNTIAVGTADWDTLWSDAVHDHSSNAEGGVLTTTLLDNTSGGTSGLTTKAITSNQHYLHNAATTGVHGAGSKYIALSTTDGLDLSDHDSRHSYLGADEIAIRDLLVPRGYPVFNKIWYDETGFTKSVSGGSFSTGFEFGALNSGSTANNYGCLYTTIWTNKSDTNHYIRAICRISNRQNPTAQEIWFGLLTNPTAPTTTEKHVAFKIINADVYATTGDGSTETAVDTGIDIVNLSSYNLYICFVGSEAKFYVNDVLRATITTNLPTAGNLSWTIYIKTTENLNKQIFVYPFYMIKGV